MWAPLQNRVPEGSHLSTIVDFSSVPAGSRLILYNDAPAPVPAFDTRFDYYTGNPDQLVIGGSASTLAGFGPNTRTIMQFRVRAAPAAPVAYNLANLQAQLPVAYVASQPEPIIPQTTYPGAYQAAVDTYSRIYSNSLTFTPVGGGAPVTVPFISKAIQELFEPEFGRMNATLGTELPFTTALIQTTIPLGYVDPPTEIMASEQAQIWKITHNGVDTHAIHFHLADVQLINRIGWDGTIKPPDANELGWKDTIRMNPLEDIVVALRAVTPRVPFGVPNSVRALDVTRPLGTAGNWFANVDPYTNTPLTTINALYNYSWEYVWHCHLLGHEENDMMRPLVLQVPTTLPPPPTNLQATRTGVLTWTDPTPAATALGDPRNEIGFRIQRSINAGAFIEIGQALANATTFTDPAVRSNATNRYRVVAFNASGNSPASNIAGVLGAVAPGAPTVGTASPSFLAATVAFTPPASDGGSPITLYTATSTPGGIQGTGTASPITVTGLTAGTAYTFKVRATNSVGTGPASASSNSVTPVSDVVPAAPTIGTASALNGQARVAFTAPAPNGGSPILSYTATSTPGGITATGTASPITVKGLTNGTAYRFTVTATNAVGTGPASALSNSVTPVAVPSAPSNLAAALSAPGNPLAVRLTWTDNSTNEVGFRVFRATNAAFTQGAVSFLVSGSNVTTYNNTTVQPGTTYYYRVLAYNAGGNSAYSNVVTVTTP